MKLLTYILLGISTGAIVGIVLTILAAVAFLDPQIIINESGMVIDRFFMAAGFFGGLIMYFVSELDEALDEVV